MIVFFGGAPRDPYRTHIAHLFLLDLDLDLYTKFGDNQVEIATLPVFYARGYPQALKTN